MSGRSASAHAGYDAPRISLTRLGIPVATLPAGRYTCQRDSPCCRDGTPASANKSNIVLQLTGISKSFGGRTLFSDLTWRLDPGERIGLVGPNGAGKSTLCRIIAGVHAPDSGRIVTPRGYRVGYLPQEMSGAEDGTGRTVLDEVLSGCPEILEIEARICVLHAAMHGVSGQALDALVAEFGELETRLTVLEGHSLRARAQAILSGMGFRNDDADRPMAEFSGGWQMRAHLSRLLLARPDALLMDEPTNHLDLPSLEWLEGFLRSYPGTVVLISHDRYFLNRMVTSIADLDAETLTLYNGDYDRFVEQKAESMERLMASVARQQRERARLERFVERFKAKATKAKQAQSRAKMLEKMDVIEGPAPRKGRIGFQFPQPVRSGADVIELKGVGKHYGDHIVYGSVDFRIRRGEKVVLVGPNGAGKTTLLKILAGTLDHDGERLLGYRVDVGYFGQHQVDALDLDSTVLGLMEGAATGDNVGRVRGLLGAFLFSGDDVDKRVGVLSGGEKSRLALCRMLLAPANFLLLDEPTNHLDIESRDVLEDALSNFEGTVCFVSHDRHFINEIATRVVHVEYGALVDYPGDYEYYHHRRLAEAKEVDAAQTESEATGNSRRDRRRDQAEARKRRAQALGDLPELLDKVESAVARLEADREAVRQQMSDPALYEDPERARKAIAREGTLGARLDELYVRWEELGARIEEIEATLED